MQLDSLLNHLKRIYCTIFQPKKADEKPCGKIELENFHKCVHAPKKECKKSPNTFTLELPKPEEKTNQKSKSTAKVQLN